MDESRQTKQSGIPRPSKIPTTASKLPVPRSNSVRASPSRESLGASTGSLRNPKVRPTPSRDQLATPTATASRPPPSAAPLRAVSSPQSRPTRAGLDAAKGGGQLPSQEARSGPAIRGSLRQQRSQQWLSSAAMPQEDNVSGGSVAAGSEDNAGESTFPASASKIGAHSALSAAEGTPLRNRRSVQSSHPPPVKTTPAKAVRASIHGLQTPNAIPVPRSLTPSPDKRTHDLPAPTSGAKTLALRPTKRPSVNGLYRKPSAPALGKTAAAQAPRKASTASQRSSATSNEGTAPSGSSIASASTATTNDGSEPGQTYRKTSAALREQIAKAKAAKRAAASRQSSSSHPESLSEEPPLVPTDTTFDFGLSNDPFNQHRDDKSQAKVLHGRLESARTSGRLNIAAMGLREIPADVLNMYNLESVGRPGAAWAESVDLTRFVAADNELEMINDSVFPDVDPQEFMDDEDPQGNIFAALETLDLHGNMLVALPMGLRRLSLLTSLNLSLNRLANNSLEVICQITSLKDLKIGGNLLYGPLDPCFSNLENLEILDLHSNNISSLPSNFGNLSRLRILNISENSLEDLPFEILAGLPLTELNARKNQLNGTLIRDSVDSLPTLQTLDISSNQLVHICSPGTSVTMPALQQLCVSMNRLQALPDISGWTSLLTLVADENNINAIPDGFTALENLRSVDFSSNDIRVVPNEVGRMENLALLRLSGNPLREKKFSSISTEEMKAILLERLEPPPEEPQDEPESSVAAASNPDPATSDMAAPGTNHGAPGQDDQDDSRSDLDDFATPPTSAPGSPVSTRSQTMSGQMWPVKSGGVLDRSNTQSSSLHPVICSKIATTHKIYEAQLHHNLFASLPESLTFFAETLTALSLAYNQLVGENYLGAISGSGSGVLELPALKELNLAHNHITSLSPLIAHLRAPNLQKLDLSFNRVAALPQGSQLRDTFGNLTVLLVSNNHLADLEPDSIRGLRVVDAKNNDIAHLNPRIGLLGGVLERLEVSGNRFRVPRWNVLERGTEATLRWLRGRVPVAEMGAWKENGGEEGEEDLD